MDPLSPQPFCTEAIIVFCHQKQKNVFVALYDPSHLITRSREEHIEKDIFRFVIIKTFVDFVALCESRRGGNGNRVEE